MKPYEEPAFREPGARVSYLPLADMRAALPTARRAWLIQSRPTTIETPDGRYLKNLEAFPAHNDDGSRFAEFHRETWELSGGKHPSNYASAFHATFPSVKVRFPVNHLLAPRFAGGWQEAIMSGILKGRWLRYDIRSAYLSALGDWLPDPATYRVVKWRKGVSADNTIWVLSHTPRETLPHPFNSSRIVAATTEEIELYDLRDVKLSYGVRWSRPYDTAPMRELIMKSSYWKYTARAYWGRWAMVAGTECVTDNTSWILPNPYANLPWAHFIVGRIRLRLFHEVIRGDVAHVFVDSIITNSARAERNVVGGWKLDRVYPDGIKVRGPGQYGPMFGPYDRFAGISRDDPRRARELEQRAEPLAEFPVQGI